MRIRQIKMCKYKCEATISIDVVGKDPVVKTCNKPALYFFGSLGLQSTVCEECCKRLKEKYPSVRVEKIT